MSPWCRTGRPGPQDVSHANAEGGSGSEGWKKPKSARLQQERFKKTRGWRFKIVRVAYETASCEGRLNRVIRFKQFLSFTEKR